MSRISGSSIHPFLQINSNVTAFQLRFDAMNAGFSKAASNPIQIAAMMTGGFFSQWGNGLFRAFAPILLQRNSLLVSAGAQLSSLSLEVLSFEMMSRGLNSIFSENRGDQNLFNLHGEGGIYHGLAHSFVNFGTVRFFGHCVSEGVLLRRALQNVGMVEGHRLAAHLGLESKSQEDYLSQLLEAEVSTWQMNAGMALGRLCSGGKVHVIERNLSRPPLTASTPRSMEGTPADTFLNSMAAAGGGRIKRLMRKVFNFRPYQQEMIDQLREDIRSKVSPWLGVAAPMQTGKSKMTGPIIEMLREEMGADVRVIILSSAKIITEQLLTDLRDHLHEPIAQFDSRKKDVVKRTQMPRVIVASALSFAKHLDLFDPHTKTVLINDEAYSTQTETFCKIYEHFKVGTLENIDGRSLLRPHESQNRVIGFSGTGGGLEGYHVSAQYDLLSAIQDGWIRHMHGDRVMMKLDNEERRLGSERMIWWKATDQNADLLVEIYLDRIHGKYNRSLVYVPTIQHGELLLKAFRKRLGKEYGALLHSLLEENEFKTELAKWEQNAGPLISVRMMGRGFRATDTGAVFHTYQTTSPEYFAQRTGRAWGKASVEMEDLYVLEATWNARGSFTNLARLLGLVDYPLTLRTRDLGRIKEEQGQRRRQQDELDAAIIRGEVATSFVGIPLEQSWRQKFNEVCTQFKGIAKLSKHTHIPQEILTGYALGALPMRWSHMEVLENLFGGREKALKLWVGSWRKVVSELLEGRKSVLDVFADDLLEWNEKFPKGKGNIHEASVALDEIMQRRLPYLAKFYYVRKQANAEVTSADLELLDQSMRLLDRISADANLDLHEFTFRGRDLLRASLSDAEWRRYWLELRAQADRLSQEKEMDGKVRALARGQLETLTRHAFIRQGWEVNPTNAKERLLYEARRAVLSRYGNSLPSYADIQGIGNQEWSMVRRWLAGESIEYKGRSQPSYFYDRVRFLLEGLEIPRWKIDKWIVAAVAHERNWSFIEQGSTWNRLRAMMRYRLAMKSGGDFPYEQLPEFKEVQFRTSNKDESKTVHAYSSAVQVNGFRDLWIRDGISEESSRTKMFSQYRLYHHAMIRLGAHPSEFVPLLYEHVRQEYEKFEDSNGRAGRELFDTMEWLLMKHRTLLAEDVSIFDRDLALEEASVESTDELHGRMDAQHWTGIFLHKLTLRQADVLRRYFGLRGVEKQNFVEIGEEYLVSNARIRQIQLQAMERIKSFWKVECWTRKFPKDAMPPSL